MMTSQKSERPLFGDRCSSSNKDADIAFLFFPPCPYDRYDSNASASDSSDEGDDSEDEGAKKKAKKVKVVKEKKERKPRKEVGNISEDFEDNQTPFQSKTVSKPSSYSLLD